MDKRKAVGMREKLWGWIREKLWGWIREKLWG